MAAQTVNNNQSRVWRLRGEQGPVRLRVAPMLWTGQFLTHGLEGLNDVAESRGLAAWGEVTCPLSPRREVARPWEQQLLARAGMGTRVAAVYHPLHPRAFTRRGKTLLGNSLPLDL